MVYRDADGEAKERVCSGTIGTGRRRNGLAVRCAAAACSASVLRDRNKAPRRRVPCTTCNLTIAAI